MSIARLLVYLVIAATLVVGGVVVADVFFMPWLIHKQGEVLVPELVGMSEAEAAKESQSLGLQLVIAEQEFSMDSLPGTVLEQSPAPFSSVRRGRSLRVVLSKGEARVRVPDLGGLSLRQCELTLLREGLRLGRVSRSFDPSGSLGVVAQRPWAGIELTRGASINILLREGAERSWHRVPSLTGKNLVRVREELSSAGFELRRVTYRKENDSFPGTILDQWPPAGSRIPWGGSLELVASSRN